MHIKATFKFYYIEFFISIFSVQYNIQINHLTIQIILLEQGEIVITLGVFHKSFTHYQCAIQVNCTLKFLLSLLDTSMIYSVKFNPQVWVESWTT